MPAAEAGGLGHALAGKYIQLFRHLSGYHHKSTTNAERAARSIVGCMEVPDIARALDGFQASQLKETLEVVKYLAVLSAAESENGGVLSSLPIARLVDAGISTTKIRSAVEVFQKVHEATHGGPVKGGLLSQPLPAPRMREERGKAILHGLPWIPLAELDSILSRREDVTPLISIAIRYNPAGIYLLDAPENPCALTKQLYKCLAFIHTHGHVSLKQIAKELNTESSNAQRAVKEINARFAQRLGRGRGLVLHSSAGYTLDQIRFSISGS